MNVETRQLAHRVSLALQKLEGAVLSCLPPEQRREVALSPAFCEFRVALQAISDPQPRPVPASWPTSAAWEQEAADMGLHVLRHNQGAHVQFVQDGKVLAEWWPSKGTTMTDGKHGPRCGTGEAVIAWLKGV